MSIPLSAHRGHLGLSVVLTFFLVSCMGRDRGIIPPPTFPLSRTGVGYAVVTLSYAPVMDVPDPKGVSLGFQRRGAVLPVAERRTVVAGTTARRWIRVEGTQGGWIRESAVEIYDTEAQARTAAGVLPQ